MIKFKSNLKNVEQALTQTEERALEAVGTFVRSESQMRSPVKTGNLRDSNDYRVEKDKVIVGNSVEYAIHVHEGTSRQKEQKFLEGAVMENRERIQSLIEGQLKL
jgi:HK97 gp10 family phage protein